MAYELCEVTNNEITSEKWNLPNVDSVACYLPNASLGNNELLCLPYQLLYNHYYLAITWKVSLAEKKLYAHVRH